MTSRAVCSHCNATETAMKPLTTHEEFCLKNAAHFVAARGRTPATRTREPLRASQAAIARIVEQGSHGHADRATKFAQRQVEAGNIYFAALIAVERRFAAQHVEQGVMLRVTPDQLLHTRFGLCEALLLKQRGHAAKFGRRRFGSDGR